jgi:hypothetical protein
MKTQVMTFKISNSFAEWARNFDSHAEMQKAAGMTPIFRGPHEAEILESGHILETTEVNKYL